MTTEIQKLEKELKMLSEARAKKSISVNEYCDFYYAISQKIMKLK
tara:strand:- start:22370 stop:22504 length:135 start_codon:yes stop_codon:yes gene_type:complete